MARPAKNNCDYFPHDRDMRDHKKIKAIRSKFGIMGFGVWVMLLEYLTGNDGNVFEYSDLEFELMSGDFGVSATEIRSVVDYCISLQLLFVEKGFVKSESLDERLLPVYEKRGKAKELSKQQQRVNGKFAHNNTDSSVVSVTEMPQSRVKESKGNKKEEKVEKIKTLEWFNSHFDELFLENLKRTHRGKDLQQAINESWIYLSSDAARLNISDQTACKKLLNTWLSNQKIKKTNGVETVSVYKRGRRLGEDQ